MTSYNVTAELEDRFDDQAAERLLDELVDYHPAVSRSTSGHIEVVLTLPADSVRQALVTALSVLGAVGHVVSAISVLTTDEFDRRLGLEPIPELLSVTEAAEQLGVSRQAVQQRIDSGALPARKVGGTYALPRGGVLAFAAQTRAQAAAAGIEVGDGSAAAGVTQAVAESAKRRAASKKKDSR